MRLEQRRGSNTRRQMLHQENSEQAGQEEQQRVAGKAVWCEEEDKRAAQCSERPDGCELQPLLSSVAAVLSRKPPVKHM